MLKQLLALIAEDELRTSSELAIALAVPVSLVTQMAEQLARTGYLAESQQCSAGCDGCPLKRACGAQSGLRFWALTKKGMLLVTAEGG